MVGTKKRWMTALLVLVLAVCLSALCWFVLPTKNINAADGSGSETTTEQPVAGESQSAEALQQAIDAAADGETVQMTSDVTGNITIADGKNIVLDLNGYTLTGSDRRPVITNNGTFQLYANNNVTAGGSVIRGADSTGVVIKNNGTMTVYNNGISVKNLNTGDTLYLIENNSKLTFSSLTYDGGVNTYAAAGGNLILNNNEAATVTINKGNLNGSIYNNVGTVSIKGGTYSEIPNYNYFADGYVWTENAGGTFDAVKSESGFVAAIGNIGYTSLADAVWSTDTGDVDATEITIIGEGNVVNGAGVVIDGQNVIINLNGKTYNVINPTVGSPGTETNGFQMLKGSTVVFKNGSIASDVAKILLQNYCDLTLENVTINATGSSIQYIASNNNGSFTAVGNTQLIAGEGQVAFDVYYNLGGSYPDGVTVTFGEEFTGKVTGKVEYGVSNAVDGWEEKTVLNISGGEFDITISPSGTTAQDANINISGGDFTQAFDGAYLASDAVLYPTADGAFAVADQATAEQETIGVAQIGQVIYETLADAVWSTDTGDVDATVITIIGEGNVVNGAGVKFDGQNVIIDLNGKTYNVINPTVGSPGTETNGFQMLKGSTVVFKNGSIASDVAKILLQNYCDLTLENVTINATGSSIQYIASNNNGSFTAVGNTQLIAGEGQVAFDVYYNLGGSYPDGVTVTFGEEFTGKVTGKVEYGVSNAVDGWEEKTVLNISGGEFDITISPSGTTAQDANINISGGDFTQAFDGAYLASDAVLYPTADGAFAVADQATAEQETIGVAQIGQVIYETLADALAAAQDGDEIDLLTNISAPGAINITNDITLDFNGHAIDSDRTIAIVIDGANANIISTGARGTLNTPANGISVINGSNVEISDIDIYTEIYILKKDDGSQQVYDGRAIQIVGSTAVIDNVVTSLTADNADYTVAHWYIGDSDVTITNSCVILVYTRSAASAENGSLQGYAVYSDNSDVTIENSSISSTGDETAYGVIFFGNMAIADAAAANGEGFKTLSLTGTAVIADAFAVSGNGTPNDCSGTDIVITGDCKIKSNYAQAIYHPQYGVLTINLTEDSALAYIRGVSGIEMRAGELVVIGGYIEATGDELDSMPNGNGSTTSGAAIAIVQHTTKQPINVRLDGGVFNGVFAVYEENQQNNEQAAVEKISLAINGGVFNGRIGSENLVDFVNGGKFAVMPEETYFADNYTGELYDGYYVVIEAVTEDNVALIEAQLAAQADARNYLAALGLTLADLETSAESGAADIVALYDAIADATSVSGAQLAKLRLMDAADEFVAARQAALDAYKAEKIAALETLAGDGYVPAYAIAAINGAASVAEVDACYNAAVAEINAAALAAELDAYKAEKIAALETLAGDGYVPAYAIAAINGAASVAEVDACYNAAVAEINAADDGDGISLTGVYVMLGVILVVAVAALMILLLKKQKQAEAAEAKAAAPLDRELAEVKQAVEADETAAAVSDAAEDDDKEQIVIAANVRTFDEAYDELDEEQKKLFNDVKDYALTKEGAALTELSSGVCVKKGSKQIVKLTVRRGNPVALFVIENEMIKDFRRNSDAPVKLKVKATELVLRSGGDLEAAKAMVDVAVDQIEKDILAAKERRREARRLRRQRKREQKRQ